MTWDKAKAKREIRKFFEKRRLCAKKATASVGDGKVYELYCLVKTLEWLKSEYSVTVRFKGTAVDFKASPGNIDRNRSYFEITGSGGTLELHTDIEVQTLGSILSGGNIDSSGYHEIDLVLIDSSVADGQKPRYDQLFLGVECKAHANFGKGIVKQVLGVRRELSLRLAQSKPCDLDRFFGNPVIRWLNAEPASLYWLAFTDKKGFDYSHSPRAFEIDFKNWKP